MADGRTLAYSDREPFGVPSQIAIDPAPEVSALEIVLQLVPELEGWGETLDGRFLGLGDAAVFDGSNSASVPDAEAWEPGGS